jgi:hypothetical protein
MRSLNLIIQIFLQQITPSSGLQLNETKTYAKQVKPNSPAGIRIIDFLEKSGVSNFVFVVRLRLLFKWPRRPFYVARVLGQLSSKINLIELVRLLIYELAV